MNPIRKFIGKFFNFKKSEKPLVPKVEHSTVAAPKPQETVKRVSLKHPLGIGHSMHRLKGIGRHGVRASTMTRAFKEAFYKEYGRRLK